jgi:putative transposase
MPNFRRYFVAGGTFFFTLVTYGRRRFLTTELARDCLRDAIAAVRAERQFEIQAIVLLPEHLHTLWTLPREDTDYSTRWRRIKERFTTAYLAGGGRECEIAASRQKRGERGVWQRRFWEHMIRDEDDFERHFDYIHYNPVKHGLVKCPSEWPFSTFARCVESGIYSPDWGCLKRGVLTFRGLDRTAHE